MIKNAFPLSQVIGQRLRALRRLAGFTREELARVAQVGVASISFWEHGQLSNPLHKKSVDKLLSAFLMRGLIVTARWLLEGKGELPQFKQKIITLPEIEDLSEGPKHNTEEEAALISAPSLEEILIFKNLPNSIVTQIEHDHLAPFLKKGNWVGGIFSEILPLEGIQLAIVEEDSFLHVYWLRKQTEITDIESINFSTQHPLKKLHVEKIAPICRLWR